MASKIFLFEQIFFGSTSRRVSSGMSFSPFVREFRALANSAKLTAGAPDFDMNHSWNSPYHPGQIRRTLYPAKKPRLRLHDIVSEGVHVSRDSRQPKTVGIQGCGVWWLRLAAFCREESLRCRADSSAAYSSALSSSLSGNQD
jgi:hypothetical protein